MPFENGRAMSRGLFRYSKLQQGPRAPLPRFGSRLSSPSKPGQTSARPTCHGRHDTVKANLLNERRRFMASDAKNLAKTPLYDCHVAAGGKMGSFAGFTMPIEYSGHSHQDSHHWTRNNASLFDVSHMVQHGFSGPLAEQLLMTVTPSSLDKLKTGTSTLTALLNDQGGIVDDTVISRLGPDSFYVVTNAGRRDADMAYFQDAIRELLGDKAMAEHLNWEVLEHHGLLALQGPKAAEVLQPLLATTENAGEADLSTLYFGQSRQLRLRLFSPMLHITRTGYTGEDGFEISIPATDAATSRELSSSIARLLLDDGSVVRWAGLAARDSLRLEAGMCLYGHDINESTTPSMAGLSWIVGKDRRSRDTPSRPFKGQDAVLAHIEKPSSMPQRRVGMFVDKGPVAREGADILDPESGEVIGRVTSGCPSPSLGGRNIAMGMIKNGSHKSGTQVAVKVRNKVIKAEITKLPFVESRFYRPS